jgi:hypothetical protein
MDITRKNQGTTEDIVVTHVLKEGNPNQFLNDENNLLELHRSWER